MFDEKPFDFKRVILKNGLELISVKKETNIMSMNIGIKVGALYEKQKEKGISHFVEHMVFKGTQNSNYVEINDLLEDLGGDYNAYTDYMYTVFSCVALKGELENSAKVFSDIICNSKFPLEEIEKERGVILSELKSSKDDIEDLSIRRVNEFAFNKCGLKFDVLGLEENIRTYSRNDLYDYYKSYYRPNNSVIVIVSSYEHDFIEKCIERHFGVWEPKSIIVPSFFIEKNKMLYKESYKKDIEQSTIVFLYTFYDLNDDEELALRILNNRLGESSNSVLFKELRENRGLAYDVYTSLDCGENIKIMYIYTATDMENIDEVIKCIEECINHVKDKSFIFDNKTLELMKKIFETSLITTMEDTTELNGYILSQSMEERDIFEFIKETKCLQNMKSEHIYNVANKVLNNPTIHVLKNID